MVHPHDSDPHDLIAIFHKIGRGIRRITWAVVAVALILFLNLIHVGSAR